LVVNVLKIQDTYKALILPDLITVYNVFLAKQFFTSLPTSILESAKIDGCNQFQILCKIAMPLSKTILAVTAIMTFMGNWNTFFWPFLVCNSEKMQTIQVGLKNFSFANTTYFSPMMAGATISALPMFILFFSLQKYFLEGVTVGAVKG
jgi:multiple sugar transport system permease protein